MSKSKFPRADALEVARELYETLNHSCEKLKVAGSLRRGAQTVADIELIAIPKLDSVKADLFGQESLVRDRFSEALEALIRLDVLSKRLSTAGSEAWGPKNKLAVHVASGIPVDFFSTTAENWWVTLAVRTGPKASNIRLAAAAIKRGWRLNAYGSGFTSSGGARHDCDSERDVFTFVGLPYLSPERRR